MGTVWLYLFQTLRKKQIQFLVRTNINSGKVLNKTFAFLKITFKGLPLNLFFRVVKFQDFFYVDCKPHYKTLKQAPRYNYVYNIKPFTILKSNLPAPLRLPPQKKQEQQQQQQQK